jgi:hypothetical protein
MRKVNGRIVKKTIKDKMKRRKAMKKLAIFMALCMVLVVAGFASAQIQPPPDTPYAQKNHLGSLLVWPLIDNVFHNTIIEIANEGNAAQANAATGGASGNIFLDCYMITHEGPVEPTPPTLFSKRDFRITLTPKEVFWWDTGRANPDRGLPSFDGDKGFMFCWAVNGVNTRVEIDYDLLKGDALVYAGGRAFQYNAIPHQMLAFQAPARMLALDGVEYNMGTQTIMFEGFAEDYAGIDGVLAVASLAIDFELSIQPQFNILFSCWNENEQGFSTDKAFYQFTQYDYGDDLDLDLDGVFTPKFHCATTSFFNPMWAVAYEAVGSYMWGTNVFQDPNAVAPILVWLPPIVAQ